jgi:DNA polymerase V
MPSSDFTQSLMDLNDLVVEHPAATYFVQVQGHSMKDAGIFSGDLLVVDRAVEAKTGAIVVAVIDGEFTIKKLSSVQGKRFLVAENGDYEPIELKEGMNVEIWGVVTFVVHRV